jgi:hypothetical protein
MFTRKTTLHPDDAIAEILLVLFAHASGVLNRNGRAQPFQCSRPNLSSCNPYLYRRSYPHFDRSYWTHNGPNN